MALIPVTHRMDGFHHWWDILVGGLIGTSCAFIAYRMTFASIWDFRFNHVLLPRTTSLFMRRPAADVGALTFGYGLGESGQWPFTREGGWGDEKEVRSGAPFDASALGGGGGGGILGGGGGATTRTNGTSGMHNPHAVENV